jgi:hypothetical protein
MYHFILSTIPPDGPAIATRTAAAFRVTIEPSPVPTDWTVIDAFAGDDEPLLRITRLDDKDVRHVRAEIRQQAAKRAVHPTQTAAINSRLGSLVHGVMLDFNAHTLDEDGWSSLELLEAKLAGELDGITYSYVDGVFDRDNEPICEFRD